MNTTLVGAGVRRAEMIAALSMATDLAMGQPVEFALKSCVLGMRLGEALSLADDALGEIYHHALLRYIGCNAETYSMVALFGDELELRRDFALVDPGRAAEMMPFVFSHLRRARDGAGSFELLAHVARGLPTAKAMAAETLAGHCEVAQRLAERLGLSGHVQHNLGQIYERWDGRGLPRGLKGEAIAPAVRVVTLAQDAIVLRAAHGDAAALAKLKARRGGAYDPSVVDRFLRASSELIGDIDAVSWETVLALEPKPHPVLSEAELDAACLAIADFADLKSPYTPGHSRAVSALAGDAARRCGLPKADIVDVARAGLLHDLGQVAVSTRIWIKPGPLGDAEWEQVRLHPYYGERVLSRPKALARLGAIVGQHHERLDGSGYHRGARAAALTPQGRVLAAAEAYQGLVEARPHRPAHRREAAAEALKREARAGRLDSGGVAAVLAAAGHQAIPRRQLVAGLTDREVDVLRLIARGQSMKEIARNLGISPKTVDNHIQHLYAKIEVRTRAGATLFAIERGLTEPTLGP
jgi:HD-GYP domain-containing protein (c-di-GMP phosphodiesterase class II)